MTHTYIDDLKCVIDEIYYVKLSHDNWPNTKLQLIQQYPGDQIIKIVSQFNSLKNIAFELECYLVWLLFLMLPNEPKCRIISTNMILANDPVSYITFIKNIAIEFKENSSRSYKTLTPRTSQIDCNTKSIVVTYRRGAAGKFITGIINAVDSGDIDKDLIITDEGEYKHEQRQNRKMLDFHSEVTPKHLVEVLSTMTTPTAVFSTHVEDNALIRKFLPNVKIVNVTANNDNDKLAAWFNAISKHSLGVERWEGIENHPSRPNSKSDALKLLSSKVHNINSMMVAFSAMPLNDQKEILLSKLIFSPEKDIDISIEYPKYKLDNVVELPFSCIRFSDVDTFTAIINSIIPLNENSEAFVRRNFNNYCQKQNHLMMREPEEYTKQILEKASKFLEKFR